MGVCLHQIFSSQLPLSQVAEQVMVIPAGEVLDVATTGAPKILYCLGGEATLSPEDGVTFEVVPGDAVILPFDQRQRYTSLHSCGPMQVHMLVIRFERERHPAAPGTDTALQDYLKATFTENRHIASRGSYALWELASRIRHESESARFLRHRHTCELAKMFTFRVAQHARLHGGVPLPRQVAWVWEICDRFLHHPSQKPQPRKEVAGELAVSTVTLNRAFREVVGHSYARHIDWMTIEQAKLLLLNSHLPVATIARRFAFSSASAFSRAFKKITGLTPKSYQNSYDGTPLTWSNPVTRKAGFQHRHQRVGLLDETWKEVVFPARLRLRQRSIVTALRGAVTLKVGGSEHHLDEGDRVALLIGAGERITGQPRFPRSRKKASVLIIQQGAIAPDAAGNSEVLLLFKRLEAVLAQERSLFAKIPLWSDLLLLRAEIIGRSTALDRHGELVIASLCRLVTVQVMRTLLTLPEAREATPAAAPRHRLLLSHANNFIQKHYRHPLTLNEIAWAVGVSGEHLARVFRLETGRTVMDHVQMYRISRARSLLVKSNKTIVEIAEYLNYSTVPLFYRVFRRYTGCTPGEFRRKGIGALP